MQVCLVLLWEGPHVSASVFGVVMGRTSCECKSFCQVTIM